MNKLKIMNKNLKAFLQGVINIFSSFLEIKEKKKRIFYYRRNGKLLIKIIRDKTQVSYKEIN